MDSCACEWGRVTKREWSRSRRAMNATAENLTLDLDPSPLPLPPTEPASSCTGNLFRLLNCVTLDNEHRLLAVVILALACVVLSLCVLVCLLALIVHKISAIWVTAALDNALESDKSDLTNSDNPRKGLLGNGAFRSSFASTKRKNESKKKKASFADDTSCAPPRDVDEEDL